MRAYWKRILSGAAALLLSLTLSVPVHAASDFSDYTDVPIASPCYESVTYLAEHGITVGTGDGYFSPDAPVTVCQWAVMLCRAFGCTDTAAENSFGSGYILEAYRNGWLDYPAILAPNSQV